MAELCVCNWQIVINVSFFQCPMFKIESDGKQVAEQYAEEAKYFTEVRLLQRDVKIVLESVSNQNCIGSVLHPVSKEGTFCYLSCGLSVLLQ